MLDSQAQASRVTDVQRRLSSVVCHPSSEAEQRSAVVAEARAWRGAAYHHMARVRPNSAAGERGATDCAQLLACVYHAAGLIPEVPLEYYPPDWHLHRGIERYLSRVAAYATPLLMLEDRERRTEDPFRRGQPPESAAMATSPSSARRGVELASRCHLSSGASPRAPGPGDLALWRLGRCFAHGAIVTQWPRVVHAMAGIGVLEEDIERNGMFRDRPRRFFTLW